MNIPAEAVEAAARALLPDTEPEALKGGFWWGNVGRPPMATIEARKNAATEANDAR